MNKMQIMVDADDYYKLESEVAELKAKLEKYEVPRRYIDVKDQPALILEEGKFHKWEDEDGIDWEWFDRDVECDTCIDVALVRADKLAELQAKLAELESPLKYNPAPVYTSNCIRHPAAPHGVDVDASWRAGKTVCICQSWAPGDAS